MEIEVKYLLPNNQDKYEILNDQFVQNIFVPETDSTIKMHAFYFDTVDYDLKKNGLSFRIRYEGEKLICTTKYGGGANSGLHRREEINVEVDEEVLSNPSVDVFKEFDVYHKFKEVLGQKELVKLIEMEYERCELNIDNGLFNAVLSIDEGKIITKNGEEKIFELEIELVNGLESEMVHYGDKIAQKFGLIPCDKSKLQRGFEKIR